jgi:DNA-binding XRE family transcriptional regulator
MLEREDALLPRDGLVQLSGIVIETCMTGHALLSAGERVSPSPGEAVALDGRSSIDRRLASARVKPDARAHSSVVLTSQVRAARIDSCERIGSFLPLDPWAGDHAGRTRYATRRSACVGVTQHAPADQALAATIRRLREQRGQTQEDLAHEARVTTAALGRIERGVANPQWTTVKQIASALRIPVHELAAASEHAES